MPHLAEDLARLMRDATLDEPVLIPARNDEDEQDDDLCANIQALALTASELATELQQAHDINQDGGALLGRRIAAIGLVLKRSAEIARTAHKLEDFTIRCIMSRLISLSGDQYERKLLVHFESERADTVLPVS